MDIAKIRKKIKEEEQKSGSRPKASSEKKEELVEQEQEESGAVDAKGGEQEVESPAAKPQPAVPPPLVSEQEAVKEKSSPEPAVKIVKPEEEVSGQVELLTFQLAAEEFAFRISDVEEILTPQQITPVPKAPDYILGITSVRGKVMPVLDLKKRLFLKDNGVPGKLRKKILTLKGPKGRVGTMIDRINGVIRIARAEIAEPPAHLSESDLMFMEGVVLYNNRFISVIRLEEAANINLK